MFRFIINSILLGVGLAMDAFSVSIVNGLKEPHMRHIKTMKIAATFGFFQFAMPMIGWVCVHKISEDFVYVQKFIPWIALLLLVGIGGKMLFEGIHQKRSEGDGENEISDSLNIGELKGLTLILQGIATSIDALSVGFTIAKYNAAEAFACSVFIAVTTFIICIFGLLFGKRFGNKLAENATIVGGIILIIIGIEIFFDSII